MTVNGCVGVTHCCSLFVVEIVLCGNDDDDDDDDDDDYSGASGASGDGDADAQGLRGDVFCC